MCTSVPTMEYLVIHSSGSFIKVVHPDNHPHPSVSHEAEASGGYQAGPHFLTGCNNTGILLLLLSLRKLGNRMAIEP